MPFNPIALIGHGGLYVRYAGLAGMNAATIAFLLSGFLIAYVLIGYPILLGWISRRQERPVRRGPTLRTVSVLIAVHNGERFLRDKLSSIKALNYPEELVEVIILSDGSTDRTEAIAGEFDGIKLISLPRCGKPAALNAGVAAATGEILFFTDVRQKLHSGALRRLVSAFDDPSVGVVSGELVILRGDSQEQENISLYRRYENWIRSHLSRVDSIFGATGCIYAVRRDLAVPIPADMLLDDMYLPLAAFFRGYRLIFDEQAQAYDYPTALDAEFSRKVRTLAGNFQVIKAYPALLGPRNRMWLHFVSYKFARLILPWLLIVAVISSLFLPDPLRRVVVGVEVLCILLVAVDPWLPETFIVKRLTSPLRTFAGLMAAALCSIAVLVVPPRKLWKQTRVAIPVR